MDELGPLLWETVNEFPLRPMLFVPSLERQRYAHQSIPAQIRQYVELIQDEILPRLAVVASECRSSMLSAEGAMVLSSVTQGVESVLAKLTELSSNPPPPSLDGSIQESDFAQYCGTVRALARVAERQLDQAIAFLRTHDERWHARFWKHLDRDGLYAERVAEARR